MWILLKIGKANSCLTEDYQKKQEEMEIIHVGKVLYIKLIMFHRFNVYFLCLFHFQINFNLFEFYI